ncbi:heparin lyase I family protein [Pseudomonas sp. RC10]|uniref:heparin lyase I family protein n=1 Tax=Pseudomonas bambusae TaxID=3139142 RepID=UPI0031397FF6
MTPINSLIRTTPLELSTTQHASTSSGQPSQERSVGSGNSAVSFASQPQNSHVDFGARSPALQQQNNVNSGIANQGDPLAQLVTLIQEMLQRLQALMQGGPVSADTSAGHTAPRSNPATNAGHDSVSNEPSGASPTQASKGGRGNPASGNFSEHALGNQLSVQKSPEDRIGMAKDPERGDVIKVDFNKGHYTEHSTSPRAEIKDGTKLQEGQPYSFKFGMKREANNDGTFFQVLDHNNAKPSPRAWLATKDGQYQLHLKTSEDSNAPSKVFNIGKPGDAAKDVGKWADFQIDFKRGIGNGEISVTKNGESVFDKKGISTMFDTHSSDSYAKFGQYRNEGDHNPATSLFSGFSVAKG